MFTTHKKTWLAGAAVAAFFGLAGVAVYAWDGCCTDPGDEVSAARRGRATVHACPDDHCAVDTVGARRARKGHRYAADVHCQGNENCPWHTASTGRNGKNVSGRNKSRPQAYRRTSCGHWWRWLPGHSRRCRWNGRYGC